MSNIREELELAAFIREIDGNNKMGACRLAEKILDWQAARAQEGGEAAPATEWLRCQLCGQMEPFHASGCNTEYGQYTHPGVSVPEGYGLVEKGITPTHVLEAGLECFRLLNQSGIADDRTLVLSVFQDMLLAIDKERATTPQTANNWIKCSERMPGSGNWLVYRPDAPQDAQVVTLWYDPYHNGWSGQYKVVAWMHCPNPPAEGAE